MYRLSFDVCWFSLDYLYEYVKFTIGMIGHESGHLLKCLLGNFACFLSSGSRCVSDCRSRGREFDPGPVPYFRGDWSWNNFYAHSPPFRWFIQEGLLSVTSESMCTNYWLTACSSLPRKNVFKWTDRPAMTIAVDMGRKATKTNKQIIWCFFTKSYFSETSFRDTFRVTQCRAWSGSTLFAKVISRRQ